MSLIHTLGYTGAALTMASAISWAAIHEDSPLRDHLVNQNAQIKPKIEKNAPVVNYNNITGDQWIRYAETAGQSRVAPNLIRIDNGVFGGTPEERSLTPKPTVNTHRVIDAQSRVRRDGGQKLYVAKSNTAMAGAGRSERYHPTFKAPRFTYPDNPLWDDMSHSQRNALARGGYRSMGARSGNYRKTIYQTAKATNGSAFTNQVDSYFGRSSVFGDNLRVGEDGASAWRGRDASSRVWTGRSVAGYRSGVNPYTNNFARIWDNRFNSLANSSNKHAQLNGRNGQVSGTIGGVQVNRITPNTYNQRTFTNPFARDDDRSR